MNKIYIFLLLIVSTLPINLLAASKDNKTVEGKFVKVVWGDYQHLVINKEGKELHFWCHDETPLNCDLLEKKEPFYKDKVLVVTYETLSSYIQEAAEMVKQDRIISIRLKE